MICNFELLIDSDATRSTSQLFDVLIELSNEEILGILRESSFFLTLQEYIDKTGGLDSAEKLMALINGTDDSSFDG